MINNLRKIFLISFLFASCNFDRSKEGFLNPGKVTYRVKTISTAKYPVVIDNRIKYEPNPHFSDSLRNNKRVFLQLKYDLIDSTQVDTLGYLVVIENDSTQRLWELEFDSRLKITSSVEMSYEERNFFIEEGKKMRKKMR